MRALSVPGTGLQRVGEGVGTGGSAPESQDARAGPAPVLCIHSTDKRGKERP